MKPYSSAENQVGTFLAYQQNEEYVVYIDTLQSYMSMQLIYINSKKINYFNLKLKIKYHFHI